MEITGILLTIAVITVSIAYICGIHPYITMSGSMEPALNTGSICFINSNAEYEDMKKGDVIAFETFLGDLVVHRVIGITEDGLETQGDANDVSDGISADENNFRGKFVFSLPYLGYAAAFLQKPTGIIAAVIIIVSNIAGIILDMIGEKNI